MQGEEGGLEPALKDYIFKNFQEQIREENYLTAGHPQNTLHQLRCCLGSSRQSTKRMGLKSSANIFISVHYQISQIF